MNGLGELASPYRIHYEREFTTWGEVNVIEVKSETRNGVKRTVYRDVIARRTTMAEADEYIWNLPSRYE